MEIKKPYLHTDTDWETIYKNKTNIFDLYAQIILLSDLTGKSFKELGELVGNYDQDINGNLDASKSVIENLSIVAENLTSVENRVNANEQRLTSVESRVKRIEDDGIGNYIGTYRTRDNDDSSTLPNPAQDKDRAITEYLSGDDYKYQEWEWNKLGNNTWDKLGVELDSHIHSQSNGITLADVANQQDPKIAKKLDKATFELYEEKEITTTPAIKEIKQYFSATIPSNLPDEIDLNNIISISILIEISANSHVSVPMVKETTNYRASYLGKDVFIKNDKSMVDNFKVGSQLTISYWVETTPAIKAIVLVKK